MGLNERFLAPHGIQWGYFRNADYARIRYSHVPTGAKAAEAAVILLPGFSEFGEKYFELMRDLAAHGYEIWQMEWRGYGGSDRYLDDPEMGHSLGPEHDIRDLDQFLREVVKPASGSPLSLIAHSMGAPIATRSLHDYPGRFTAAVLCSPLFSLSPDTGRGMPD